jgi:hypothetical protein
MFWSWALATAAIEANVQIANFIFLCLVGWQGRLYDVIDDDRSNKIIDDVMEMARK